MARRRARGSTWEMRLPGATALGILLPVAFGLLAVSTAALPARIPSAVVLAPAALTLWTVWVLWAHPSMTYRGNGFVIRNVFQTVSFTASSRIAVTGTGVPRIAYGGTSIRPLVMMVSPGGVLDTMHAAHGVNRGVNVVPMASLTPGHETHPDRATAIVRAVCERAGDVDPEVTRRGNVPEIAVTAALLAWTITTFLI